MLNILVLKPIPRHTWCIYSFAFFLEHSPSAQNPPKKHIRSLSEGGRKISQESQSSSQFLKEEREERDGAMERKRGALDGEVYF